MWRNQTLCRRLLGDLLVAQRLAGLFEDFVGGVEVDQGGTLKNPRISALTK